MNTDSLFKPYHYLGADAYGTGIYGCGEYQEGCTTGTGDNGDGGLVNTGYNIVIPVALAAALIISAAILLIVRLVRRRKARSHA